MRNKIFIGIVTFFFTIGIIIIVSFNFTNSKDVINYSFDRNFKNSDNLLKFEKQYDKMNDNDYVMYVNSDNYIVERDKKEINLITDNYKFFIEDLSFKNKSIINLQLPKESNILFCNPNKVIFTNNFKLFTYSTATKNTIEINLNGVKVISLKPVINSKSKYICFAEYFQNNLYKTGFYIIDFVTDQIVPTKIVETSTHTSVPKMALSYSGKFSTFRNNKITCYYCDKYSKIYFFNSDGFFIKELTSADNTPLPNIIENKEGYSFYSRKGTWNSNMGVFMQNNNFFVLSASGKEFNTLIIDEYSYGDLKYIKSYKLNYNNQNSFNVREVFADHDKIIIGFEFYYASFIFSRYI
jgi:hypothetical protein